MALYDVFQNSLGESQAFTADKVGKAQSTTQVATWLQEGLTVGDCGTGSLKNQAEYHRNTGNAYNAPGAAGIGPLYSTDAYTALINS